MDSDFSRVVAKIRKFNVDRDWDRFHKPKDILVALVSEVGELAECYRWLSDEAIEGINNDSEKKRHIEEEVADVMILLMTLAYKSGIDPISAVEDKLEKNAKRYPVEHIKGKTTNPIEGSKGVR